MPYSKGNRRTSVKKKVFGPAKSSKQSSDLRAAAVSMARGVNAATRGLQLAEGEFKSVDAGATVDVDTTGTLTLLNGIARGDEINERNGREVTMRSIEFHGDIYPTVTTGTACQGRVLIVYDRQANAAALTVAQVLNAVSTTAPRNLENRRRFKILMDRRLTLPNSSAAAAGSEEHKQINYYRRLRHPITFNNGDAGTIADITTGSLYVITVGSNVKGVTGANLTFSSRVRYQDK